MTLPWTDVSFDMDYIEDVVGEFEVCCDLGIAECTRPAEWVMWRACCGAYSLGCDPCKEVRMRNGIAVMCGNCEAIWIDAADCYTHVELIDRKPHA